MTDLSCNVHHNQKIATKLSTICKKKVLYNYLQKCCPERRLAKKNCKEVKFAQKSYSERQFAKSKRNYPKRQLKKDVSRWWMRNCGICVVYLV